MKGVSAYAFAGAEGKWLAHQKIAIDVWRWTDNANNPRPWVTLVASDGFGKMISAVRVAI